MHDVLIDFAALVRNSASAGKESTRDFTIGYEKFLRASGHADGDARELAELRLRQVEFESNGLFRVDRETRSGLPIRIRLVRLGGEDWLFARVGQPAPASCHRRLAGFFERASETVVPPGFSADWKTWCADMATRALAGSSIYPFDREDQGLNGQLLEALTGVLNWQEEALVRNASAVICGDSKRLQKLETRLTDPLARITGEGSLEAFGILKKPRVLTFHGPLTLRIGGKMLDFSPLPGPVSLSEANLSDAESLETTARLCLTVENEDVFVEIARRNPGILLVHTSFPGAAVRRFFGLLPTCVACHHFGDTDPAGFDILRDLRAKTGRVIHPFLMDPRPGSSGEAFTHHEKQTLSRLLESNGMADLRQILLGLLESGGKGDFEQERIPVQRVISSISAILAGTSRETS